MTLRCVRRTGAADQSGGGGPSGGVSAAEHFVTPGLTVLLPPTHHLFMTEERFLKNLQVLATIRNKCNGMQCNAESVVLRSVNLWEILFAYLSLLLCIPVATCNSEFSCLPLTNITKASVRTDPSIRP